MSLVDLAPLSEDADSHLNVLYMGEVGSGKTTCAAHMARLGRVVWVVGEAGLKVAPLRRLGVPTENIIPFRELTYSALERLRNELRDALLEDPTSYAGVVFDTFNEVQMRILEHDTNARIALSQQDWGVSTSQMTLLLRHFTDLPCHVAFTAHVKRDEDDDGAVTYRPSTTPKVSSTLVGLPDVICHTMTAPAAGSEEPDFVGIFRPLGKYRGKDQLGVLPPRLIRPTFDRIVAYVDGTYRREAQREADRSDGVPDGLDAEQYEYRQRLAAAKKIAESKGEAA